MTLNRKYYVLETTKNDYLQGYTPICYTPEILYAMIFVSESAAALFNKTFFDNKCKILFVESKINVEAI